MCRGTEIVMLLLPLLAQTQPGKPSAHYSNAKPLLLAHSSSRIPRPSSVFSSTYSGYRPQFHRNQQATCAIQYTEEPDRIDPNSIVGAVSKLTYKDKAPLPAFNEVQVRVYNIDRYGMSPLAAKALGKNIEGIWHVGVAVFGKEYWYGAIVESQTLADVDYAFGFGPSHIYNLGTTDVDPEEFHKWVMEGKAQEYVPNTYDCFNHNCHHFANDLVIKLTGKTPQTGGFPQWCLDHGEQALSEKTEQEQKTITWVSNRIAKVMMISWGKYNRDRFVDKDGKVFAGQATGLSAQFSGMVSISTVVLMGFLVGIGVILAMIRYRSRTAALDMQSSYLAL
eukprot:gnl/MRDRNA2_/MRDRNA2_151386_c0_seq1.p1 gnl/MRDRNA2_/MRDRNA2_151386_c0~~gnl/MRDRNA2_/MRDRNA2_151386_c0_seq1.p1  ORF type:complete len:336 (+),score=45.08 gnl/MRDRNA2_/MRDRNA2_151386_c0_seq1:151-1158(+)